MEALLSEDSCQGQEELAVSLGVTQQAISKRLKELGIIQKEGHWVPHKLKPRDVERRLFACELFTCVTHIVERESKLRIEIKNKNWQLKLKIGIENKNGKSKLEIEFENWNWNFELNIQIKNRNKK